MAQHFDLGATVRLKSGGPVMTVGRFGDFSLGARKDHYLCTWFDAQGNKRESLFAQHELELVAPATNGPSKVERA